MVGWVFLLCNTKTLLLTQRWIQLPQAPMSPISSRGRFESLT
jgi:hypothetical protein